MEKEPDKVKTRSMENGTTFIEYPEGVVISTPNPEMARRLPSPEEVREAIQRAMEARETIRKHQEILEKVNKAREAREHSILSKEFGTI